MNRGIAARFRVVQLILGTNEKGREKERYTVVYGAKVKVEEGQTVKLGATLVEWDPYTFATLTEVGGTISFKDLVEGVTMHEELDEVTGLSRWVVTDSPDEKRQPTIQIRDDKHKVLRKYLIPSRAHLMPRKARHSSRFAALARDNPISGPLTC